MAGFQVTSEPAAEPVSLEEARNFLKQDAEDDNDLIQRLLAAARRHVERETRLSLVRRTVEATFDEWPVARPAGTVSWPLTKIRQPALLLPMAFPLHSVRKVEYLDLDGATQTLATSIYEVVTTRMPGRVRLGKDQVWPDTQDDEDVITVTYDVGYGEDDDVPDDAKVAMLLLLGHWYYNRTAAEVAASSKQVPHGYAALIGGLRIPRVD